MAQGVKRIVAVPVLAGFALSLMVLATLVGSVQAQTACEACPGELVLPIPTAGRCVLRVHKSIYVCLPEQLGEN